MKDREFATVARFSSMEQAQVVKAMLDSMGVNNQIVNDIAADILPMLERDIRIIVNTADLPKAKQLMKAKFDKESFKDAWKSFSALSFCVADGMLCPDDEPQRVSGRLKGTASMSPWPVSPACAGRSSCSLRLPGLYAGMRFRADCKPCRRACVRV